MGDQGAPSVSAQAAQSFDVEAPWLVILILVSLPLLFSAIGLFPEVRYCVPTHNDQVFHYLFIERANQAISAGDNPFDHWLPELELGFPEFFYYQNLPHLVVVGLYRLLLKQVSLLRLLNLVRYMLLVTFPLTVYWSMRQMEFTPIAAAVGAALAPMIASRVDYGFDFRSYTFNGIGMYPQLCAMHLMFVGSACVHRVLKHGDRFAVAIIASSALVLSDLLYGYMFAIVIAVLLLLTVLQNRPADETAQAIASSLQRAMLRLGILFIPVAAIIAYQAVPFFRENQYLNTALPPRLSSPGNLIGAVPILSTLRRIQYSAFILPLPLKELMFFFGGHFFDNGRLPSITIIVIVGIIYAAITRRDDSILAVTMMGIWMVLLVPNALRNLVVPFMPFLRLVPFFRFVAGVDFGAILVAGLGGECIWRWCRVRPAPMRVLAPIGLLVIFYTPLMVERWSFYQDNARDIELTDRAFQEDPDLAQIFSWLRKAPPGRVYAGTRGNWGTWMNVGSLHLYDLLPIEQFQTLMPWQTLSLNAPLLWQLNIPTPELCQLFNIRYVIAPANLNLPAFYNRALETSRFVVYQVDSGGYLQLGQVDQVRPTHSNYGLFRYNDQWIKSFHPEEARFTAFIAPGKESSRDLPMLLGQSIHSTESASLGQVLDETVTPDSLSANVIAKSSALLVIKVTYHPNWHVIVDGREQFTFMVSPSYIGTRIEAGRHQVKAEYRSSRLKKMLLVLSGLCLFGTLVIGVAPRILD